MFQKSGGQTTAHTARTTARGTSIQISTPAPHAIAIKTHRAHMGPAISRTHSDCATSTNTENAAPISTRVAASSAGLPMSSISAAPQATGSHTPAKRARMRTRTRLRARIGKPAWKSEARSWGRLWNQHMAMSKANIPMNSRGSTAPATALAAVPPGRIAFHQLPDHTGSPRLPPTISMNSSSSGTCAQRMPLTPSVSLMLC